MLRHGFESRSTSPRGFPRSLNSPRIVSKKDHKYGSRNGLSTHPPLVAHKLRPTVAFLVIGGELADPPPLFQGGGHAPCNQAVAQTTVCKGRQARQRQAGATKGSGLHCYGLCSYGHIVIPQGRHGRPMLKRASHPSQRGSDTSPVDKARGQQRQTRP